MENKPLVGIFATFIRDYIPLVDDLYYCEACHSLWGF
jgi:hypothetical protein